MKKINMKIIENWKFGKWNYKFRKWYNKRKRKKNNIKEIYYVYNRNYKGMFNQKST